MLEILQDLLKGPTLPPPIQVKIATIKDIKGFEYWVKNSYKQSDPSLDFAVFAKTLLESPEAEKYLNKDSLLYLFCTVSGRSINMTKADKPFFLCDLVFLAFQMKCSSPALEAVIMQVKTEIDQRRTPLRPDDSTALCMQRLGLTPQVTSRTPAALNESSHDQTSSDELRASAPARFADQDIIKFVEMNAQFYIMRCRFNYGDGVDELLVAAHNKRINRFIENIGQPAWKQFSKNFFSNVNTIVDLFDNDLMVLAENFYTTFFDEFKGMLLAQQQVNPGLCAPPFIPYRLIPNWTLDKVLAFYCIDLETLTETGQVRPEQSATPALRR